MTEPREPHRPLPIDLPLSTPPALDLLTRPVELMVRGAGGTVRAGVTGNVSPVPAEPSSGGGIPAAAPPAEEGV
jgi:hypothetical protein